MPTTVHSFSAHRLDGESLPLSSFAGKVLLIVNTASKCGFTPQYRGLQALYDRYRERGFELLGFPCNQFGEQEPGDSAKIGAFCEKNYGVTFPMFEKIDVNGPHAHPLFAHLTARKPGIFGTPSIKWNFTKFLIDRDGNVVSRYAPFTKPENISVKIESLLDKK